MKNIEMLATVAKGLGDLKDQVVFVGGATIELYVDDKTAPRIRATDDVDCVAEIVSRSQLHDLEDKLRELGFKNVPEGPVCRWEYAGILVDVMPTEGEVLTFKNTWYPDGFANAETASLPDGTEIKIFSVPFFLASKLEAFDDRGNMDFLASPDLEDVLAVLDGAKDVETKVTASPEKVKAWITERFESLLKSDGFLDALDGHLPSAGGTRGTRVRQLLERLSE